MRPMEKAELVNTLKELIGEQSTESSFLFEFIVDKVEETVCNYCNIDTVPEGLKTTLLSMCIDIYRTENYGSKEQNSTIKSTSEGDVSVVFETGYSSNPAAVFLKNYQAQLNRYRKVGW